MNAMINNLDKVILPDVGIKWSPNGRDTIK